MNSRVPVDAYINQLLKLVDNRARTPIEPKQLRALYVAKDYHGMALCMRDSLRLELPIRLDIVADGPAPLWIQMPNPFPSYGTYQFKHTTVIIKIRRDIIDQNPFEWLVAGLAHELCHVVLSSVDHPLKEIEQAVDLLAMIMGYQEFICNAQKKTNVGLGWVATLALLPFGVLWRSGKRVERLGYLSEGDAYYARVILNRHRRLQSI